MTSIFKDKDEDLDFNEVNFDLCNPIIYNVNKKMNQFETLFYYFDIYTTRFNSFTYLENFRYKQNNDISGSIYSVTLKMPKNASNTKFLFVFEMNNTTNQIMGIGLIKNKLANKQNIQIYSNQSFNSYVYKSNFHIPLIDTENHNTYFKHIHKSWIQFIQDEFIDKIFYGKSHLKRGGSFSRFHLKLIKKKHIMFLLCLFIQINPNNFCDVVLANFNIHE